jgi:hypothetical protein
MADLSALVNTRSEWQNFRDFASTVYPLRRLKGLPNIVSAIVANEVGVGGPVLTIVGDDRAGLAAIDDAASMLMRPSIEIVCCGAVQGSFTARGTQAFAACAIFQRSADPESDETPRITTNMSRGSLTVRSKSRELNVQLSEPSLSDDSYPPELNDGVRRQVTTWHCALISACRTLMCYEVPE